MSMGIKWYQIPYCRSITQSIDNTHSTHAAKYDGYIFSSARGCSSTKALVEKRLQRWEALPSLGDLWVVARRCYATEGGGYWEIGEGDGENRDSGEKGGGGEKEKTARRGGGGEKEKRAGKGSSAPPSHPLTFVIISSTESKFAK